MFVSEAQNELFGCRFRLPPSAASEGVQDGIALPDLFEALELCSQESDLVTDYSVSQTTLEQV